VAEPKAKDVLLEPIFDRNPIALEVLGVCSALAVTTKLQTSVTMAVSVIFVLALSNVAISLIRHHIPNNIRIIVQMTIIASLVIVVDQFLKAFFCLSSRPLASCKPRSPTADPETRIEQTTQRMVATSKVWPMLSFCIPVLSAFDVGLDHVVVKQGRHAIAEEDRQHDPFGIGRIDHTD